jgi:putative ABC transport system ATP-binding protein
LDGSDLASLDQGSLTRIRRRQIGFVFQSFNLLPTLSAVENTALPLMLDGVSPDAAKRKATYLLERVGLRHRLGHFPQQLSGGEMQRVGIARAVCHDPLLLLADEPTGNLDSANGADVLELLSELNRSLEVTVLLATHSAELAAAGQRVLHMVDGRIESERRVGDPYPAN